MGTVTHQGSLTIGGALPGVSAAFESAMPDIQARLDALAGFSASTGSFSANLQLAQDIVANIQAAMALGISAPSIDAQLAEAEAAIAVEEGKLAAAAELLATLEASGLHLYTYSGTASAFGGDFNAEIGGGLPGGGGGGASVNGAVLITEVAATWTKLLELLP